MAETVRGRNRIAPPVTCCFTTRVICLPYEGLVTRPSRVWASIEYRRSSPRFTIVFWGRAHFASLLLPFFSLLLSPASIEDDLTFHFHLLEITTLVHSYYHIYIYTGHRGAIYFLSKGNFRSKPRRTFNREGVVGWIPRILWRGLRTAEEGLPRRGTSPPGIVRGTAAARPWPARGRGGRATSGYFSCRLLLRCGDYVCPLICAETRQLGPLSAQWVSGSAGLLGPPGMLYHLSPGAFTHTFRPASPLVPRENGR